MALDVGSIFASVGARFDDSGFDRFDRRLDAAHRKAARGVEADLKADVDSRGFQRFDREVSKAERSSGRLKGAIAKVGPLAAAGGAAAAAGFGLLAKSAVDAASDVSESLSKNRVLFRKYAKDVEQFAETSAKSYGISKRSALEYTGTFGNLFRALGETRKASADYSTDLVKLAADMASFNNTSIEDALEAIRSGLVGETEPLRRFGVNMNDATLQTEALRLGLIKNTKESLDPHTKALAANALIMKQTSAAHGDFQRTSGGLANQTRILKAQLDDSAASLGRRLLPAALFVTKGLNGLVSAFSGSGKSSSGFARAVGRAVDVVRDLGRWVVRAFNDVRDAFSGGNADATRLGRNVSSTFRRVIDTVRDLGRSIARTFAGAGDDFAIIGRAILKFYSVASSIFAGIIRRVLPGVKTAFQGFAEVVRGVVRVIAGVLSGDFSKVWQGLEGIVGGALKAVRGVIRASTAPIREAIAGLGRAIGSAFSSAVSSIPRIAVGFVNTIIGVLNKLPGVNIGKIGGGGGGGGASSSSSGGDGLGGDLPGGIPATASAARRQGLTGNAGDGLIRQFFAGGVVDAPIAIVGEEAPTHPEVIIPSNPAYRRRAVALWQTAGRMLGIPGFALGGVIGKLGSGVISGAKTLAGAAGKIVGRLAGLLPENPFPSPFGGLGSFALNAAKDFIADKAKGAAKALGFGKSSGGGGTGIGTRSGTLGLANRVASKFGLHITSGYRTPEHNAAVGGVPNSDHTHGSPGNPGAIDLVGPVPAMYRALAWALKNIPLRQALVHDVGSGLHLHLGFFARGGIRGRGPLASAAKKKKKKKTKPPKLTTEANRGIARSRARAERGIGSFEDAIQGLERDYDQTDRRFDLTDEDYLIENEDGSTTVNTEAVNQRKGELTELITKRTAIRSKILAYRAALRKAIAAYTKIIATLKKALAAAKGKSRAKERETYRDRIADYVSRRGELRSTLRDLGFDVTDSDIDLTELGNELTEVGGTAATPAKADDSGSSSSSDTADNPEASVVQARADALAADLATARDNLTTFTSGEFLFGAGTAGGGAAARALLAANPALAGAFGPAGAVGGQAFAGGMYGAPTVNVTVRSFLPPSGAEAARLAYVIAGALDSQPYRVDPVRSV